VSDPSAIVVDNDATLTLNRSYLWGGATSIRTSGTLHASDVTTTTTSPTGTRIDMSGDTRLNAVTTTGGTTGVPAPGR
jgi:hypothetical protein